MYIISVDVGSISSNSSIWLCKTKLKHRGRAKPYYDCVDQERCGAFASEN